MTADELRKLVSEFSEDVGRMRLLLAPHGKEVDDLIVTAAWSSYSDALCANWLRLPESDQELLKILLKHLPAVRSHWIVALRAAADGSGDYLLPLPNEAIAQLGWQDGEQVHATLDADGRMTIVRAK